MVCRFILRILKKQGNVTFQMGESNLRTREKLLPSEKGFTYKAMMEALRKQPGIRLGEGLRDRTREILAKNIGQSGRQIQKYINITKLIPELLKLVDAGRIGICPADAMSRLPEYVQKYIFQYYTENEVTPSHGQVIRMEKMHEEKPLTKEAIDELLEQPKGNTVIMADGCLHEFLYAFVKDVEAHRLFEFGRMGCGLSGAEEKAQKTENS